jgi:H+-translocating NAD(P) transhydrogenase subunit alpha
MMGKPPLQAFDKAPSPQRGEGKKWAAWPRLVASIFALTAALLAPAPAFAAGIGGPIEPVIYELMVFAMAIFVGYYVVWSVTPALHTPLMSVTNAISSVIVVGALLAVAVEHGGMDSFTNFDGSLASKIFGLLALAMAAVNIFGGFLVTQRMLSMYKKKGDKR